MTKAKQILKIAGRNVPVSNLEKVMYPGYRFTKGNVIDFYIRISKYLLPHLKDRPVTLKRYPNGVFEEFFYEKDAPAFTPEWVKTFPVPRKDRSQPDIRYILINNLATLVWLANLGNLEIHPFLHRVPAIDRPTSIVFDCDPGEGADVLTCARVAIMLRNLLRDLKLESWAKVSGSKGIQLHVPLNTPIDYEITQPFSKAIAELMEQREPKLVVSQMPKVFRARKVFIDWSQNADFKTTVSVYSLRAKTYKPFVSIPIAWDELEEALADKNREQLYFNPDTAFDRLEKFGDLFKPLLTTKQRLPKDVLSFFEEAKPSSSGAAESLKTYERKRNFSKTAEPKPNTKRSRQGSRRRFVIQKHAASHLHYDFRLEMHDVLKSWAVPKGPPFDEDEKRLAMPTEDHPIEYLDFEGVIPKGQYGGGTVMVWDLGTYDLIEGNYYKGYLRFHLWGAKLKGEWTLQKLKPDGADNRDKWHMLKTGGNTRRVSAKRDDLSVLSGRTMEEIRRARDAVWQSDRA